MTYQTNPLLVSAALEMALQAYDLGARRSGRTTAVLDAVKAGDVVLCAGVAEQRSLTYQLRGRGVRADVRIVGANYFDVQRFLQGLDAGARLHPPPRLGQKVLRARTARRPPAHGGRHGYVDVVCRAPARACHTEGIQAMTCQARQYSDQMQCGRCGLAWDVNDPDPPKCSPRPAPLPLSRPKRMPAAFRSKSARFRDANRDVLERE